MKFGTIIADPPWAYARTSRHETLSGYSDVKYESLSTERLCSLPVEMLATEESVLLLWTTWPFLSDALRVMNAWGFTFVTGLPWVKVEKNETLSYGVGYWFRGCTEPILVGKRMRSYRTNYAGYIGETLTHSRKPDSVHEIAEKSFPGPYLELFARRLREGWTCVGNESPETPGEDILMSLARLLRA